MPKDLVGKFVLVLIEGGKFAAAVVKDIDDLGRPVAALENDGRKVVLSTNVANKETRWVSEEFYNEMKEVAEYYRHLEKAKEDLANF